MKVTLSRQTLQGHRTKLKRKEKQNDRIADRFIYLLSDSTKAIQFSLNVYDS